MSDEQPGSERQGQSAQPEPPAKDRWGDPISDERQAELKALADQQRAWAAAPDDQGRASYFQDVPLTGADVFWLAAYTLAGPEGDFATARNQLHLANVRVHYTPASGEVGALSPDLSALHLEGADLREAHLEGAVLLAAHLEHADFRRAHLELASFDGTHLERASFDEAHLEGAGLVGTHLERAYLSGAHLERDKLILVHLERANLYQAHLEGADLSYAHLEGAYLYQARLEGKTYRPGDADLVRIRQSIPNFPATLPPADLRLAFLDAATALDDIYLGDATGGTVQVADVRWGGVNLAVVDWTSFTDGKAVLGDEQAAQDFKPEPFSESAEQRKRPRGERARARVEHVALQAQDQLYLFQAAVRANRQLATVLRDEGMNEEADHFAYRAQVLQRRVFHLQHKRLRAGFSRFLDLLAGYGYAPQRSLIWYVLTVLGFAALYLVFAHLPPQEALILSVTSFHGRGFPGSLSLHDPIMSVAATEAVFGLLIEISFIATFTQRFFAR